MLKVIPQTFLFLIKILIVISLSSCNEDQKTNAKNPYRSYEKGEITLPSGEKLTIFLAISPEQQQLGLSHIQSSEFKSNEGMIFLDKNYSARQFWMPETFFNLDIFFLNEDLYVLDVHRNLQHFPNAEPRDQIPLSKRVYCKHVLELRADSELSKKIQPGMILNWSSSKSPLQIGLDTHPSQ